MAFVKAVSWFQPTFYNTDLPQMTKAKSEINEKKNHLTGQPSNSEGK